MHRTNAAPFKPLASLALSLSLALGLAPAVRGEGPVEVTLPDFPVTLGGQTVEASTEEYPFLRYRDITYLPLTYYGCRLLGLYEKWTPEGGLVISDLGATGAYLSTPRTSGNGGTLYAAPATGKITVCGQEVDNAREDYPFLVFRNITYLPMTWAYMHDLLGCEYSYSREAGLDIRRPSDGHISALSLPLFRSENGPLGAVAAWQGYFWFTDTEGWFSRVPLAGGEPERLLELPRNHVAEEHPVFTVLLPREEGLVLGYHLGGATMGHDESFLFAPDGSHIALSRSSMAVAERDGVRAQVNQNMMPPPGNLSLSRDGGETYEAFGSERYIYGWAYHAVPEGEAGGSTDRELVFLDGGLYLLGCDVGERFGLPPEEGETRPALYSHVCRVDLDTGETAELTGPARRFRFAEGALWYLDFDGALHRCAPDGSGDTVLSLTGLPVWDFAVEGETVYLVAGGEAGQRRLLISAAGGPAEAFTDEPVESITIQENCLAVRFADYGGGAAPRRSFALFRNGEPLYSVRGAHVLAAAVSGEEIYLAVD